MHFTPEHIATAKALLEKAGRRGLHIAVAESCTGGLLAALLTEIPGSSAVFERGFVTYSNEAKAEMLGVKPQSLEKYGAVSSVVAGEMAYGALANSNADLALSITGVAGPGGGTDDKPVGTVYFGVAMLGDVPETFERRFPESTRSAIRTASVETALQLMSAAID